MTDSYRGESAGKRLARAELWERIADESPRFRTSNKLCLAGRTLGDLSTLESLGLSPSRVVLAERNGEAFQRAQDLRPDANLRLGDVREALDPWTTDAVFLDFCSYLWEETATVSIDVWRRLREGSFFAAAFMRGREQPREFQLPRVRQPAKRQLVFPRDRNDPVRLRQRWTKGLRRSGFNDAVTTRGVLSLGEDLAKIEHEDLAMCEAIKDPALRAQAERVCRRARLAWGVYRVLWRVLARYSEPGEHVHPIGLWVYRSGVPMVVCLFRKGAVLDGYKPAFSNRSFLRQDSCDPDAELRRRACAQGAERFNLPRGTVAAWRAHATRGTYRAAE